MITEPLREVIAGEEADNTQTATDYRDLSRAANEWAAHSLRTYTGKTLKRALAISQALVQFTEIIENPK